MTVFATGQQYGKYGSILVKDPSEFFTVLEFSNVNYFIKLYFSTAYKYWHGNCSVISMRQSRTDNHLHLMTGYVDDVIREMALIRGETSKSACTDGYNNAQDYETRLQQLQAMREKGL